ncbi:MAG: class IIb bacteriocin, lactobin A/cerein 7B family [Pseudohongiellaceae bacterium]
MRELTQNEIEQASGGVGPLAIIGIDLALNGVIIGFTSLMTSDYFNGNDS